MLIIVHIKDNVNVIKPNNIIVSTSSSLILNDTSFNGSDKVVPFIATKEKEIDCTRTKAPLKTAWKDNMITTIKSCKPNIVTKQNQHFESVGKIYSFGNKGNYGVPTVSQYVNKKSHHTIHQNKKSFSNGCSEEHLLFRIMRQQ